MATFSCNLGFNTLANFHFDSIYLHMFEVINRHGLSHQNTKSIGAAQFSCKSFPLLMARKININSLLTDLYWQLTGSSSIEGLGKYKCIWEPWANASGFLQSSYGRYIRDFPEFNPNFLRFGEVWSDKGLDQLSAAAYALAYNPLSRKQYYPLSSPQMLHGSDQPNCVSSFGLTAFDKKEKREDAYHTHYDVTINVGSRSTDFGLGLPYNLAHFWMIGKMLCATAEMLHRIAGDKVTFSLQELNFQTFNLHVYDSHVEGIQDIYSRYDHSNKLVPQCFVNKPILLNTVTTYLECVKGENDKYVPFYPTDVQDYTGLFEIYAPYAGVKKKLPMAVNENKLKN